MVEAFVLIQVEPGLMGQSVSNQVASIKGVLSAEDLSGPYDILARVQARDLDQLGKLVVARIQALPGITRTLTCPVVHLK